MKRLTLSSTRQDTPPLRWVAPTPTRLLWSRPLLFPLSGELWSVTVPSGCTHKVIFCQHKSSCQSVQMETGRHFWYSLNSDESLWSWIFANQIETTFKSSWVSVWTAPNTLSLMSLYATHLLFLLFIYFYFCFILVIRSSKNNWKLLNREICQLCDQKRCKLKPLSW